MLANADCEIKQEARLVIEAYASVCIAIPMPTLFQDSILAKQAHYLDPLHQTSFLKKKATEGYFDDSEVARIHLRDMERPVPACVL